MHLPSILLFVLTLMYCKEVQPSPTVISNDILLSTLAAICCPLILASLFAKCLLRFSNDGELENGIRNCNRIHSFFFLIALAWVYFVHHWPEYIRFYLQLDQAILVDEFLLMLPISLMGVGGFWFSYRLEKMIYYTIRGELYQGPSFISYLILHIRHRFLLPILPVFVVIMVLDFSEYLNQFAPLSNFLLVVLLGMTPIFLPWIIRIAWNVSPLPNGPVRSVVEDVVANSKIKLSEVCLWNSKCRIANAAVSGIIPRLRYLFLSDGLIGKCSLAEIRAVVAHEVSHIRKQHLLRALGSIAIPFLLTGVIVQLAKEQGVPFSHMQETIVVLSTMAIWLLFHRFYARCMEHQADIEACRLLSADLHTDSWDKNSLTHEAVSILSQSLSKLAPKNPKADKDWWHPTIPNRIALLEQCLAQKKRLERFEFSAETYHRSVVSAVMFLSFALAGLILIQ